MGRRVVVRMGKQDWPCRPRGVRQKAAFSLTNNEFAVYFVVRPWGGSVNRSSGIPRVLVTFRLHWGSGISEDDIVVSQLTLRIESADPKSKQAAPTEGDFCSSI